MQFKQIQDFPNYIVYENGIVQNIRSNKIIKADLNNQGYLRVTLSNDGNAQRFCLQRLVAEMFIGKCPDGQMVDHIDRNPLNNHFTNLRYVSQSANQRNQKSYKGTEAIYVDQIPERCIEVTQYNHHRFENYFIDPITYEMYYFNDLQYRKLNLNTTQNNSLYYCTRNNQNKAVKQSLNVLKSQYKVAEQVE
ncbi:Conserved_hypothetical protein [Hexamita inflata]|uniref:HNH nuclease domain-containing protein n=1 Tax=Hexamita inflata TaxID=28002 RepID=A0AA86QA73_9EUKA|nr:Conserved hypothetical protein [Hexamita inflata]